MTPGKVRIIGGAWRGRSIKVIDSPGLRPTADRTRETLFNCLGQRVDDLICLDMFAGTGALGFEALSRGAQKVTMIDASKQAHDALKENYLNLSKDGSLGIAEFIKANAITSASKQSENSIDICFIDPPFSEQGLFLEALKQAVRITKKNDSAAIYMEHPKEINPEKLLKEIAEYGDFWEIRRTIRSGIAIGTLMSPKTI
jgi:16S rRNA (guanine(966)-N(2))-methyltransferase RsmD